MADAAPIDNRRVLVALRCDDCGELLAIPHADGGFRVLAPEPVIEGTGRVVIVCPRCGKRVRKRPGRQAA